MPTFLLHGHRFESVNDYVDRFILPDGTEHYVMDKTRYFIDDKEVDENTFVSTYESLSKESEQ